MKRCLFMALAGALLSLCAAESSLAQIREGAVTLSPMAGSHYFDSSQDLERRPRYDLGIGYNLNERWATELVAGFSETSPEDSDEHINVYSGRVDLLYHFTPREPATFYFAMGAGMLRYDPRGALSAVDEEDDLLLNYGLGLKAMVNETAGFRFDARHILTADNEEFAGKELNHFSYSGGLYFQFGGGEEPAEVLDTDGDGISDGLDLCPQTPAGAEVDSLGCRVTEEEAAVSDSDGDGVVDTEDACPDTPSGTAVDLSGCPAQPDGDGDGVVDADDKCPNTPSYVPVNAAGCPLDSDGDYVFDFEDECPDTPTGDLVDADGCTVELQEPETVSLDIRFERGSAALQPNQAEEMEKAAQLLAKYPNATILVEGHTDSTGPSGFNQRLSQMRADTVRDYLVNTLGADAGRIQAEGFGESKPVASNASAEGRLQNRRVQITVKP